MDNKTLSRVRIDDEIFFKIDDINSIRPFFMTIVSDANHWLFISSNGGLTAGRKNSDYALFPYYTDDKVTESRDITGPLTILKCITSKATKLWEPFCVEHTSPYNISRNLYKSEVGNKVIFEEINHDLQLRFSYTWSSSIQYGFMRSATLENLGSEDYQIEMLDGLQNIMPNGVSSDLQNASSNLVDAYKRTELHPKSGLGIYALSAIIVDRAEPSESLKANVVWSCGHHNPTYLLSSKQVANFRNSIKLEQETDLKGKRGAYLVADHFSLSTKDSVSWQIVANVNQDQTAVAKLIQELGSPSKLIEKVLEDVEAGTGRLISLIAAADGLQETSDHLKNARHQSNVMFNIMRGGIFDDNYSVEKEDYLLYIRKANKAVYDQYKGSLQKQPETSSYQRILAEAMASGNSSLYRLTTEYLPLKFSRRHGDPSRPWNKFSINTIDELTGKKILDYEGNWRDIFQNWEATAHSYPAFIRGMIFKFLNASTFDGYNPYRVTKDGFDWETIEADDPWSYIGYWGDHQVIYLLKFLEFIEKHQPGELANLFDQDLFVYANVPYRIKSYSDIVKDSKDTVIFEAEKDHAVRNRRNEMGSDGALLTDPEGQIYHVNFIEKILALVLSKLSNYIPGGGIWMNTQRPEWNDANNALVGNGISMVTLYYLHRFVNFLEGVITDQGEKSVTLSKELATLFNQVDKAFFDQSTTLDNGSRKSMMDTLGQAGSDYRDSIYDHSFSGEKVALPYDALSKFLARVKDSLQHTIRLNERPDGLYHAYNLIDINETKASVLHLSEMLEGQVALLSAGFLDSTQALKVLDSLKASALFRKDQFSYILYPNKDLPGFLEKNILDNDSLAGSTLLQKLIADNERSIVSKDVNGKVHFNGNFRNADDLGEALDYLEDSPYGELASTEREQILQIFEEVFNHKAFTGRSGTFFGYEGLGSIYWHMVSKLLLAVQEVCLVAVEGEEDPATIGRLLEHFYEINEGIGVHKSPELYGAFPTDAYSHTPASKGAQQPGMTGQVKEDILSRFGELGVFISGGKLHFYPALLRKEEFLAEDRVFNHVDIHGTNKQISLSTGSLAFTFCQVPIIYKQAKEAKIEITLVDGSTNTISGHSLDKANSESVFERKGMIDRIEVQVNKSILK